MPEDKHILIITLCTIACFFSITLGVIASGFIKRLDIENDRLIKLETQMEYLLSKNID